MSILVNKDTKVICQGITGKYGTLHSQQALDYGTKLVAGTHPLKGGTSHLNLPIFSTVKEAKKETGATASVIYVPPQFAKDALEEAIDAKMELIICITKGVPTLDMLYIKEKLKKSKSILLGPNCPGIITPDECKIGIMPADIHKRGKVGIISRSGTLTYEAVLQTSENGLGQSTAIGIGSDHISGCECIDIIDMFLKDPETEAILVINEINGCNEEKIAKFVKNHKIKKPIAGFIAGIASHSDNLMGHAKTIISNKRSNKTALDKISTLKRAGIIMAESPTDMGNAVMYAIRNF